MAKKLIAEAETSNGLVQVFRYTAVDGLVMTTLYRVLVDGEVKHDRLGTEDAMRALAFYLQGEGYRATKANNDQR